MYTIGEVSQMFKLPISTLRYYDKEGVSSQVKCTLFRQQMHTFSRPVFSL
jgi:hypothetical protein